ncbi:MAG: glycosyltransferase [Patescibacteria group bacterium]
MKIIYVTDTFLPEVNGVVISVKNFSQRLAKKGHQIYIFTTKRKGSEKIEMGNNIEVKCFPATSKFINYPNFKTSYPNTLSIFREVKRIKPDIIHIHTPSPQSWSALIVAKKYKIPVIATYHTFLPDFIKHTLLGKIVLASILKEAARRYTKFFHNYLDLVIVPSRIIREELIKEGVKKPIEIISNGIDVSFFSCPLRKSVNNEVKLLHLGRISYEKNIDVILKAMAYNKEKGFRALLDIIGGGPDFDKLRKLARKLNISELVHFKGPIEHEEINKIYCGHDIFITASSIETEGIVVLEAMAAGLSIIGVKKLALLDLIKSDLNGYLAQSGNYKEIAKYIRILSKDNGKRERFGSKSIEISKQFSLGLSIEKIENIYKKLTNKN